MVHRSAPLAPSQYGQGLVLPPEGPLDEVLGRVARGKTEEGAVAELELLRAGRSLNQIVDELKHRRQRRSGLNSTRGHGRAGRCALYGRRGGLTRQHAAAAAAATAA